MHGVGVIGSCRWTTSNRSRSSACADPEDRARAEDDVRERAVRRHDHRAADRDHVGRRRAVAAVTRVQHARELPGRVVAHDRLHLAAERAERLRLELGVLDDAAPEGPRVRNDDARPSRDHYRRRAVRLRSPHDREILRLALPALGALAAEPLYVLVDTAIVGHLGRPQLAALGLAGVVLSGAFTIFNFLDLRDDGGRRAGVGRGRARASGAAGGAGALGVARDRRRAARGARGASPGRCCAALGAHGPLGPLRARLLPDRARSACPRRSIALAGQGYLRGVSNLRRPLVIVRRRERRERRARGALRLRLPLGHRRLGRRHGDRAGGDGRRVRRRAAAAARGVEAAEPRARCGRCCGSAGRSSCARRRSTRRSSSRRRCCARMGDAQLGAHQIALAALLLPRARARRGRDRGAGDRRPDARRRRRGRRVRAPRCG